jgi:hypothetical protein
MNNTKVPDLKVSPAAHEAMRKLVELFSDPSLASKAHFRCGVEGPDEFDLLFESIFDERYGYNPNSEYKCWVRSLYRLGLILRIPSEWAAPETPERKSSV